MKLQLDFTPEISNTKINVGDKITLLGSCFSDEIAIKFKENGFQVCSNPFGTIFHPTAIANLILMEDFSTSVIKREDLYFSWIAASNVYALTELELLEKLKNIQLQLIESIRTSSFLFITFGTSFAYENDAFGSVVANCHKLPNSHFTKVMSSVAEMYQDWEICLAKIYEMNPTIQVVFTVSPVRHIKDGLVENNRSKARLIELTNRLSEMTDAFYFPSYEIIIDVLRDYRFYNEDLIHPNNQSIDFVYSQLEHVFMNQATIDVCFEVRKLRKMENHRLLHPDSVKSIEFIEETKRKIEQFLQKNPLIIW